LLISDFSSKSTINNQKSAMPTMLRTGVDLIEVERIEKTIARYGDRFLNKVFSRSELEYGAGRPHVLAARFAAKEAVSKLLGLGIQHRDGVDWLEIEVVSSERGDPVLNLHGRAAARARELGLREIALSLSHTREHAIAMVVGM
jgi:holo-[acyl-carrier protein] synthase